MSQQSKSSSYKTSYNDIPYDSYPFQQSHPDRLAAVARLFGLETPDVETCRVLEIGCASGNNLIPMAEYLPKASFLGIDLSEKQIAEGKKLLGFLELPNIELRCQDILEFDEDTKFDFIIVHGIYSWVPAQVQEKILAISKKNLTPDGVAYISYNVLPGWHMRGMIRDMMLYHSAKFPDNTSKIHQAKVLLEFLSKSVQGDKNPYGIFLQSELELLRKQSDGYFYHEFLEENNFPVYFHEFNSRANRNGLKYLGDSDVRTMSTRDLAPETKEILAKTPSMIETEQYMDFLRNRMFRTSLLVHDHKTPNYTVNPSGITRFHITSTLVPAEQNMDLRATNPAKFLCHDGTTMETSEPLVKAALVGLYESSPRSMTISEILNNACARLGKSLPTGPNEMNGIIAQLGQILITAYTSLPVGSLELNTRAVGQAVTLVSSKPMAYKLAQVQASMTGTVTNQRHQMIRVGDFEKYLFTMLDGKTELSAIVSKFKELVDNNKISIKEEGLSVDPSRMKDILENQINRTLKIFARNGMLTA
ncbi:MAG: methyltransferase regulatory domain-containing protein [Gemmataceae bacterium]